METGNLDLNVIFRRTGKRRGAEGWGWSPGRAGSPRAQGCCTEHHLRHVPGRSRGNSIPALPSLPVLPFNCGCWKS